MDKGLRIAKLFGINIRIDWSWLLILLLVIWNLSSAFSQVHPDWGTPFTIVMGVIAALVFFLSVLMHELAHSLVAKSQGISVNSITLYLFGGAANIREEPKSPGSEFIMAFVGPITSLVIGFALLLIAGFGIQLENIAQPMQVLEDLNAFRTLAVWLGSINIFLAIFNLIPGFPLDGGRILRSILWAIMGNLKKATRWASYVGQTLAWGLIIIGVGMVFGVNVPIFGQGLVGGVWLVLIGWFLNNAARRSYQQLVIRDILEDVPVRKMTKRDPKTVPGHISVEMLIEDYIMQTDGQSFPVIEEGNLIGIVTLDDVRQVPDDARATQTVADIMTPRKDLITLSPEDCADEALNAISRNAIRQVVIMDGNDFFGLVRRRDIVRYLQIQSDEINPLSPRSSKA